MSITGIKSLRVGFNKVFGYYIEVSNANLKLVPDDYMRKQTLVNAERFITPELKEHEARILTAIEHIEELERSIYLDVLAPDSCILSGVDSYGQCYCAHRCLVEFC